MAEKKEQTVELRMTFKNGRLEDVEPIQREGRKYEVTKLGPDINEKVRNIAAFAIDQESPVCLYWYVYKSGGHWEKVCLVWSD